MNIPKDVDRTFSRKDHVCTHFHDVAEAKQFNLIFKESKFIDCREVNIM